MPKVMHVSFLWDDSTVNQRHSDYILSMGWVKKGWDVLYYDYRGISEEFGNTVMNDSLVNVILKHNPDIVWFTKSVGVSRRYGKKSKSCRIDPSIITRSKNLGFKGKFVHWFLDQRHELFKSTIDIGKECDWFFYVCAGDRLKRYSDIMNTPSSYILVPYEPTFMHPMPFNSRPLDLIWMGGAHKPTTNNFENTRYELLKSMISSSYLTNYYGCFGKENVYCPEYQRLLGNSRMGLSLYAFNRPLYFSNRLAHTIGSGTVIFSYDFKERQKLFSNDEGIFFKTFEEFKKKKDYYSTNLKELSLIAEKSYQKAKKYFTSTKVVEEILNTLQTGNSSLPFGQTCNPNNIKLDIPKATKEYGDVFYMDKNGDFISIDEYSSHNNSESVKNRIILDRNRLRAEKIKSLHAQKHNVRLTKRADEILNKRKPKLM